MSDTKPVAIVIPRELISELENRVSFDSDADIAAFVADAMRAYADIGKILRQDGMLMWHPAKGGTPRRVRLPGIENEE